MSATLTARRSGLDSKAIASRRRAIHQSWTPEVRAFRAEIAKRRLASLLAIIGTDEDEDDLMAVGAPACEDLQRMAG